MGHSVFKACWYNRSMLDRTSLWKFKGFSLAVLERYALYRLLTTIWPWFLGVSNAILYIGLDISMDTWFLLFGRCPFCIFLYLWL